ncbi:MAG: hypothetical protein K0U13_04615, partial [Chlamydiae bacterium]|nr:hypothetical protein [Chlamydiota bacterium]
YDHPYLLRFDDFEYNLQTIKKLLQTSPQERKELADHLYRQLADDIHHNSWLQLQQTLVSEVSQLIDT